MKTVFFILILLMLNSCSWKLPPSDPIENIFQEVAKGHSIKYLKSEEILEIIDTILGNDEYHNSEYICYISSRGLDNSAGMCTFHTYLDTFPLWFSVYLENATFREESYPDTLMWLVHSDSGIATGKTTIFDPHHFKGSPVPISDGDNLVSLLYKDGARVAHHSLLISKITAIEQFRIKPDGFYEDSTSEHTVTAKLRSDSNISKIELINIKENNTEEIVCNLEMTDTVAVGHFTRRTLVNELFLFRIKTTNHNGSISYSGVMVKGSTPQFSSYYFTDMQKVNRSRAISLKGEDIPIN